MHIKSQNVVFSDNLSDFCHFIHSGPLIFNLGNIIPKSKVIQAFSLKNTGQIHAFSPKKLMWFL